MNEASTMILTILRLLIAMLISWLMSFSMPQVIQPALADLPSEQQQILGCER
jgi:hypothetical protein